MIQYSDPSDIELISSDTDSIYAALSAETLEELVPAHLKGEFEKDRPKFMVTTPDTNRDTGLFKVECELFKSR